MDIQNTQLLSDEEVIELAKTIAQGGEKKREARNKLVEANLKLVSYWANKYRGSGVEYDELYSMGCEGLIWAAEHYDYTKGCKFGTYASFWIKQAIFRAVSQETNAIRVPVHVSEAIRKVKKAQKEYRKLNGKKASIEELVSLTNLSEKEVRNAIRRIYTVSSIEAKMGEDADSTLEEFIADETQLDPAEMAIQTSLSDAIQDLFTKLKPKEAKVLSLRFGIGGNEIMTLEEIANLPEFQVTRERIRQIESRTIAKILRTPSMTRLLEDYVA